jgi:hypothetical protein
MNSLAQQKKEYTIQLYINQLSNVITPIIYDGFKSIYDESFKIKPSGGIEMFGQLLKGIPNWSDNILDKEVGRICFEAKLGDYMNQLFNIIMMSIIMVMTATPNKLKSRIHLPENITYNRFIHNMYINTAEQLFLNPYLFNNEGKEEQEIIINKQIVHKHIINAIDHSITLLTPLTYILDKYMGLDTEIITEQRQLTEQDTEQKIVTELNRHSSIQMSPYIDNIGIDNPSNIVIEEEVKNITESVKHIEKAVTAINPVSSKDKPKSVPNPVPNPNPKFNVSDIPNTIDNNESEAYFVHKKPPLDVFNNTSYVKEASTIKTEDIKKYVATIDKTKVIHTTDDNSSVRNFVPSNKIKNVKV